MSLLSVCLFFNHHLNDLFIRLFHSFFPKTADIVYGRLHSLCHDSIACVELLSPQVHIILREELGFTGVIITDDLAMDGVRNFTGDTEAAVQAVKAGNDMLCCTDFEVQIPAVIEAVKQGEITEERINESVLRILELKISLGII